MANELEDLGGKPLMTTRWSLVARAADANAAVKRQALTELIEQYLPALRRHLIYRRRMDSSAADDVLQSFLTAKVLEKGILEHAQKSRGKFRSFILSALNRYAINHLRDQFAQKRGGGAVGPMADDFDAADGAVEPDAAFDREWARQVIRQSVDRVRDRCQAISRQDLWLIFETRILLPATEGAAPMSHEALVEKLGFATVRQVEKASAAVRKMYAECLRSVIAEYAVDDSDIEQELNDLREALSGRGS